MQERKIWEFKSQTICSILGLAFDDRELGAVCKRLKLDCGSTAYEMHGGLVQAAASQNKISKQLDKILKSRFERYEKDVRRLQQEEIYRYIDGNGGNGGTVENGTKVLDTPLSAIIWFAVRNPRGDIDGIEAMVFSLTHMYEHRASRFYDTFRRALPGGVPENALKELNDHSKANEKLQTKCNRLERKRGQMKSEIESLKEDRSRITTALDEEKRLNQELTRDLEELGFGDALDRTEALKKEIDFLTEEVKTLTEELLKRDLEASAASCELTEVAGTDCVMEPDIEDCVKSVDLNGMRVTYIGGVESLMPHYKETIESFGGTFCYHCGHCIQGKKEIEMLVDKTDIVFCPVDINSHNACRYVKKACKLRGKPCRFLRSSSLSMLIRELESRSPTVAVQ